MAEFREEVSGSTSSSVNVSRIRVSHAGPKVDGKSTALSRHARVWAGMPPRFPKNSAKSLSIRHQPLITRHALLMQPVNWPTEIKTAIEKVL